MVVISSKRCSMIHTRPELVLIPQCKGSVRHEAAFPLAIHLSASHTCVTAPEDGVVKGLFHQSSLWLLMVL